MYVFGRDDLAVVWQIADTVSVLKDGRIVESGSVEDVFDHPSDAYTRELIDAFPGRGIRSAGGAHQSTPGSTP